MARLCERFYWPGQWRDVSNWCRTCSTCATRKTLVPKSRAALGNIQTGYPMQILAVDILGPLPRSEAGNSYILVVGDYFTRWMEAYPIPNQEAATVAEVLVDQWFCCFSVPKQLHSDKGRQFESELMGEVCKILEIQKTRTTPYHPQCDGLVERFNQTLLNMLATTSKDNPYFFCVFGRQVRLPVDIMHGTDKPLETTHEEFATRLKMTLESAYTLARENIHAKQERQKGFYNQKDHGKPFSASDQVWLFSPAVPCGKPRKIHPTVIEQSTTTTQARPPLSDLEIIDEPEPDPHPTYQHSYLLQHLYLLLNRRLLLLNQRQFFGTYHRYRHLNAILSELELCRIIIQHILLTESEYGTYSLRREHCSKHCHVVVVLCIII